MRFANRNWTWRKAIFRAGIPLTLVLAAIGYRAFWHEHLKRFQVVRPGTLYRCGLASEFGLGYAVERNGIRTVITALPEDPILRRGLFDPGKPSGQRESAWLAQHRIEVVRLPMGDEACWPWPTPWQFERLFAVCDDRERWPILLHCAGGRHRTGVLAALFRLEYDRWSVPDAVAEMHSFDFGQPQTISEHNLRTYVRRPRPSAAEWRSLAELLSPVLSDSPLDYEELVDRLRARRRDSAVERAIANYIEERHPFALCLAARLVDLNDALLPASLELAATTLAESGSRVGRAASGDALETGPRAMAAALVADFGTPVEQENLLRLLADAQAAPRPDADYHQLVLGVTNRFTRNRLPYWKVLLADGRVRIDTVAPGRRYCDTATARLSVLVDQALVPGQEPSHWEQGVVSARTWMEAHAAEVHVARLIPPEGRKSGTTGNGWVTEDLSRVRR